MNVQSEMERKMAHWIRASDYCYTFQDVMDAIHNETMQSHTFGDTWVVTSVREWPQRKSVHIDLVVGNLEEFLQGLPEIERWTKSIGANLITGSGTPMWRHYKEQMPGWHLRGLMYSKDLRNER